MQAELDANASAQAATAMSARMMIALALHYGWPLYSSGVHANWRAGQLGIVSFFFRLARLSADAKAVGSGDPKRITRRAKNKLLGRGLGRAGFWRSLWK